MCRRDGGRRPVEAHRRRRGNGEVCAVKRRIQGRRWLRRTALTVVGVTAFVAAACTPAPPTPNADYQFYAYQGDGEGSAASCSATPGPPLVPWGYAGYSDGGVVESVDGINEHVQWFEKGGGWRFVTSGEMRNDAYSVVILFRFEETAGWRRLLEFKNGTSDNGLYLLNGRLTFYPRPATGARTVGVNEYVQVILTRAANGVVRGFVDGAQQWQFTDTTGDALISSASVLFFFLDEGGPAGGTEESGGAVARIRVFNRPLSNDEIRALGQTPGSPCTGP
jgi:hypothetical protein